MTTAKDSQKLRLRLSTLSCLSDRPGILSDIDLVANEKVQDYATMQ